MEKNKKIGFITLLFFFGFLLTACDDNMPEVKEIGVESIALNEDLSKGVTLRIDETIDISLKVSIAPENALNRAENYSSSSPEVASVSPKGIVTANDVGTCDITITVGGKSVSFALTVLEKAIIPIEEIRLAITGPLKIQIKTTYDLAPDVVTIPLNANELLAYSSSKPNIVTVNDDGILEGVGLGKATITVASKSNASIKTELEVEITGTPVDYLRESWTMTASHTLPITGNNKEGNSLTALLDGNLSTNFCLVRPGKGHGTPPNRAEPAIGEALHFTIDMLETRKVNYFRVRHRYDKGTDIFLRWHGFDQILGSNDGINFDIIATDVEITDVGVEAQLDSPNIAIPESTYRYIRFYAKEAKCFYQSSYTSNGNTVQMQELYIGTIEAK